MSATEPLLHPPAPAPTSDRATRAFSLSVLISGIRCSLTYVVFPWLLPFLGLATGFGSAVGVVVGVVAIVSNVFSIRRMWATDFRYKWHVTFLNSAIIVLLAVLLGLDLADLA